MKKRFFQIQALINDTLLFLYLKFIKQTEYKKKVVYVSVTNPNKYHRFFYLLLAYYHITDYTIVYPMDFQKFRNLRNGDNYLRLMFRESDFLSIKEVKSRENCLIIKDEDLSENYFKSYFAYKNQERSCYHVPMTFHPYMYHNKLWNLIPSKKVRARSLFCYGNFDEQAYLQIDNSGFSVINRKILIDHISHKPNCIKIQNETHLNDILDKKTFAKAIVIDKKIYQLPMSNIFETASHFWFHLCCPGVVMPLCHNIIETMYVGTIPIIEKEYADFMYPNLVHMENAFIFQNLDELDKILELAFYKTELAVLEQMSQNVLSYYQKYLSPESVVEKINENLQKSLIYLNAEHRSVALIPQSHI